MLNLLANITPADIIAYARQVPQPGNFLLTAASGGIVPARNRQSVKYRIKRTTTFASGAAKFRAYDTETPLGRREVQHSFTEGMLPPLGQKLVVGELETILLALEHGSDDQALLDEIYDDAEHLVQAIWARLELAAGDLLVDGVFTLEDENGLTLEADFAVPAANLPTAAVFWNADAADPLRDEQAWIAQLVDSGEARPERALTSAAVARLFGGSQTYKNDFYGDDANANIARPTLTPGQVQTVRDRWNLPSITEYDTQVRVDGVNTRPIPEEQFLLLPPSSVELAETQMGITAEALALTRAGNPRIEREDQPGIIVTAKEEDDPVRVWTKSAAVGMPVMHAPDSYISAKVLPAAA